MSLSPRSLQLQRSRDLEFVSRRRYGWPMFRKKGLACDAACAVYVVMHCRSPQTWIGGREAHAASVDRDVMNAEA